MSKKQIRQSVGQLGLLVLAVSALPTVSAECFTDESGNERCSLSNGVRIAIAVSLIVAGILLIFAAMFARRRRMRRVNQAFANHQQQYSQGQYPYGNSPYGNQYNPADAGAQYPPQQGHYSQGYGQQGGYAPPAGPPPHSNFDYNAPANPPQAHYTGSKV